MIDIGGWLYDLFGPYGAAGILLFVFLIFYIDAVLFPTLPEIFFIIGFMYDPRPEWALVILAVAAIAEACGVSTLYFIVEHIRVPERIRHAADRYSKFLIVSDERMILVNRVAPILPFAGAFISLIPSWHLGRALIYNLIGCIVKYGLIAMFASFFYAYFSGPDAQTITICFTIAVMVISLIASYYKKRKDGWDKVEDS